MRQLLISAGLAFFTVTVTAQRNIDVLHYRFEIELSDLSDTIKGKASITVKFLERSDNLSLDFVQVIKDKLVMYTYPYMADSTKTVIPVKSAKDKIQLKLMQTAKAGDVETFIIEYKGIPSDGLIISKNKYGNRTFFADNWPNRAHNWIPCKDDPADKASVEFVVTAPNHYQVVSNGMMIEETNLPENKKLTHWKETVELPTKVMVIGLAEFAVGYAGDAAGIPVYSWVYPEDKTNGFLDYAIAPEILTFYINYIGPYPYKKLANVQSKTMFGGMENAGAIFYSENSVNGKRSTESLIAHEIAHQWFGDMATEKSFAHLWLSEGFATYLTNIYLESKYGSDSLKKRMEIDRNQIIEFSKTNFQPVVDSISSLMDLLNTNSYQKGGWVLHMLQKEMGEKIFQKFIQTYYTLYKGKNADTRDLQAVAEEVSGKRMETFFRQWLYTPGIPKLKVTWQFDEKEKKMMLIAEQQQQTAFQFPLEIKILFPGDASQTTTLTISKPKESFSIPVQQKPSRVELDPGVSLLFDGSVEKK